MIESLTGPVLSALSSIVFAAIGARLALNGQPKLRWVMWCLAVMAIVEGMTSAYIAHCLYQHLFTVDFAKYRLGVGVARFVGAVFVSRYYGQIEIAMQHRDTNKPTDQDLKFMQNSKQADLYVGKLANDINERVTREHMRVSAQ